MLTLSPEITAAIVREAEAAYPNEGCGILLGTLIDDDRRVGEKILPIANRFDAGEQFHRFRIEPEDLMRAEKTARQERRELLGFYHSHPDHPAQPSEYDRDHALPFYSYVIVAVEKGKSAAVKSWRLNGKREFEAEAVN
ncbi:MAG: M67 family metallopeptidase [Planctomycetota bacterium]|jgi:proteasome lid subunit RPN8/RPN11|nr:M67 family metallopeptidase [Planctomycetota bacterium]